MTSAAGGDMLDLQFRLSGAEVLSDHAELLWDAVKVALPWFEEETLAGVHALSGLTPGTGKRYLSRHARLSLRLPRRRAQAARALSGTTLVLGEDCLTVGPAVERELLPSAVLYSRFVVFDEADEPAFFAACERALATFGANPQLVCGKARRAATVTGSLQGFSLMVYGLKPDETVRLQQQGIGLERKRGCGLFLPHKSIAAVGAPE